MSETAPKSILTPDWLRRTKATKLEAPSRAENEARFAFDPKRRDVMLVDVVVGSSADKAGLRKLDIVVSVDGQKISSTGELTKAIKERNGRTLELVVIRDGKTESIPLAPAWDEQQKTFRAGLGFIEINTAPLEIFGKEGDRESGPRVVDFTLFDAMRRPISVELRIGKLERRDKTLMRSIDRFELRQEIDGKTVTIDLLERYNATNGKMYWNPGLESTGVARHDNVVEIASPFGSNTPHVVIHEFRHLWQNEQPKFVELKERYKSVVGHDYSNAIELSIHSREGVRKLTDILSWKFDRREIERVLQPLKEKLQPDQFHMGSASTLAYDVRSKQREIRDLENPQSRRYNDLKNRNYGRILQSHIDPETVQKLRALLQELREKPEDIFGLRTKLSDMGVRYENRALSDISDTDTLAKVFRAWKEAIDGTLSRTVTTFDWTNAHEANGVMQVKYLYDDALTVSLKLRDVSRNRFQEVMEEAKQESEKEIAKRIWVENELLKEDRERYGKKSSEILNPDTVVTGSITVKDILRLPTYWIERDAEYGALVGLRTLKRETGIDLFTRTPHEKMPENTEPAGKEMTFLQKLKRETDSLAAIEHYLKVIGVPNGCSHELIKAFKSKESDVSMEANEVMPEAA